MSTQTISLDGKTYPIRATPLAKLGPLFPLLQHLDVQGATGEQMQLAAIALGEAVYHGIRRAGGEVTQDFVHDNIDMTNLADIFKIFAKVNGLVQREPASGEAQAGAAS